MSLGTSHIGSDFVAVAPQPVVCARHRPLHAHLWLPLILLALLASPCIRFMVPAAEDTISSSDEPLKTLRFFAAHGRDVHKWGPLPNFLYAPSYGVLLAYWHFTGDFSAPQGAFPYGLNRPHEQFGLMIQAARITGLLVALGAMGLLAWSIRRVGGSTWITFFLITLYISACPETTLAFGSSKPDGLMAAFGMGAIAVYALIVSSGLTRRRGFWFSVLVVCSVSCKELLAPTFAVLYLALGVAGIRGHRQNPIALRRFLRTFAACICWAVASYFLLNIAYAPAQWMMRMKVVFGPLKDPAVWATSSLTTAEYLWQSLRAIVAVLGFPGAAVLAGAAMLTLVLRPRNALLLWLPLVAHIVLVVATAGYMPTYFMLPVGILATLPVAATLADLLKKLPSGAVVCLTAPARVVAVLICAAAIWICASTCRRALAGNEQNLVEQYVTAHIDKSTPIYPLTLWRRNSGATRLSYLGYHVDDRALGALLQGKPGDLPEYIFVSAEHLKWLADFPNRPARAQMWSKSGFDYRQFRGLEPLGYQRIATLSPQPPSWCASSLLPGAGAGVTSPICVYRRPAAEAPASAHAAMH